MTKDEERDIIAKVLQGDINRFESLVLAYEKKIYNLCLRMTSSREDASDLTQEAFLKAYRRLDTFKGDSSFYLWIYKIASNTCLDFLRREKKRRSDSLTYEDESGQLIETELPDVRYSPELLMDKRNMRESINAGLRELSPEHRNILIMREIGGFSYSEIAEALGITGGTVKSRISRARRQLALCISEKGNFSAQTSSNDLKDNKGGEP